MEQTDLKVAGLFLARRDAVHCRQHFFSYSPTICNIPEHHRLRLAYDRQNQFVSLAVDRADKFQRNGVGGGSESGAMDDDAFIVDHDASVA